jgi:hypothetical protein
MRESRKRVWDAENSARVAARKATLLKSELTVGKAADPTADYTVLLGFRVAEAQETCDMATLEVARSRIARDATDAGFAQLRADIAATEAQLDGVMRADERLRQSVLRSRGRGARFTFGGRSSWGREHSAAIPSHRPNIAARHNLATTLQMTQSDATSASPSPNTHQHIDSIRGRGMRGYHCAHACRTGRMAAALPTPATSHNEIADSSERQRSNDPDDKGTDAEQG